MSIPPLIGYFVTAPGGAWWFVRTSDELQMLRDGCPERVAVPAVAWPDVHRAMLELQQQLRGEKCAALAASEILLAAMAGELTRLRALLPG